jgi:streptomycin 6-kinase
MELLDAGVQRNLALREDGRAWVAGLPALVDRLRDQWAFGDLGPRYHGGTHSLTAPVELVDGSSAVLKVPMVDEENRLEAEALRLYAGEGAVELHAFDAESGALLLEEARPGRPLEDHRDRLEAIEIGCALLRRLRRPVPQGHPFTLVTDVAAAWSLNLSTRVAGLPGAEAQRLAGEAAAAARELSRATGPPMLVNRDAHFGNILAAQREPWLLIDPKPLAGDAAFDAGYLLDWLIADDRAPAHAEQTVSRLAGGLAVSEASVCAWGLVRAMENALWALFDVGDDPTPYVETAAALSAIR